MFQIFKLNLIHGFTPAGLTTECIADSVKGSWSIKASLCVQTDILIPDIFWYKSLQKNIHIRFLIGETMPCGAFLINLALLNQDNTAVLVVDNQTLQCFGVLSAWWIEEIVHGFLLLGQNNETKSAS